LQVIFSIEDSEMRVKTRLYAVLGWLTWKVGSRKAKRKTAATVGSDKGSSDD
jgi:hypothetical protein